MSSKNMLITAMIIATGLGIVVKEFMLPSFLFTAAVLSVNAVENILDDKIEKLLEEKKQDEQ